MKILRLLPLFLVFALRLPAQSAESDLNFAFSQLKSNGPVPFARALYAGDTDSAKQLSERLGSLTGNSGDCFGYEVVSRKFITKRIERFVVAIYFEKFPVYLRIDYYDTTKGRICLPASLSKEASDLLPFEIIAAAGK